MEEMNKKLDDMLAILCDAGVQESIETLQDKVYTRYCADILHSMFCNAASHGLEHCDYYDAGLQSKALKDWMERAKKKADELGFNMKEMLIGLQKSAQAVGAFPEVYRPLLSWVVNQIAERAPRCLSVADGTYDATVERSGEASGPPRRFLDHDQ